MRHAHLLGRCDDLDLTIQIGMTCVPISLSWLSAFGLSDNLMLLR